MAYCTLADLIERYGEAELIQRADRDNDGSPDAAVVNRAIADASAEIDGYLATRYQLPLPTIPVILARIAGDMARYFLWQEQASEEVRRRYEDARRLLEAISSGKVSLGLPATLPAEQKPQLSVAAAKSGPAPLFGPDGMGEVY
ncbi:MAG: DUF1320 domain-containing protein [Acidithiobacillus sp.]|uniref:gp436 family protein n=1 Tax=Acidithiobacillus sp. TaxID=1872118 RepID=UPI002590FADE|nr:DUF1320 domain-containing protein [Acidithiobacillus sp.]MCE5420258.1 DUF1320 domain-containing protein [Acidithiobacillus sp.]